MKKKLTFDFFGSATELTAFVNKKKIKVESIVYTDDDRRYVLFYWVKE